MQIWSGLNLITPNSATPITVMGVAEDYGQNQFQFQIQFQGQENFEDATIFFVQIEKA